MKLSDAEVTPVTLSYAHVVLPFMFLTFSHAYAIVLCEREGMTSAYRVKTMIRGRWRRFRGTEERLELVNKQREEPAEAKAEAEAEVDEKAEVNSIDSLICACDSPMLIRGDCKSVLSHDTRRRLRSEEGTPRSGSDLYRANVRKSSRKAVNRAEMQSDIYLEYSSGFSSRSDGR